MSRPPILAWQSGPVPHRLAGAIVRSPLIEVSHKAALFRLPTVGRYLIRVGLPVTVDSPPHTTENDIECFLRGPVLALTALLEGRFALRAAVVAIGGQAVLLCGESGAGKSSVAAALAARGHLVMADNVAIVHGEAPVVAVVGSYLELWPDAVATLHLDASGGREVRAGLSKRSFAFPGVETAVLAGDEMALAAVVVVSRDGRIGPSPAAVIEEASGFAKFSVLTSSLWQPHLVGPLGLAGVLFSWLATIVTHCPVFLARCALDSFHTSLNELADLVESTVG